jgi:hypothetical protein
MPEDAFTRFRRLNGVPDPAKSDTLSLPEDLQELYEERAGIMEFDGGLSRDEAERQALALVTGDGARHVDIDTPEGELTYGPITNP